MSRGPSMRWRPRHGRRGAAAAPGWTRDEGRVSVVLLATLLLLLCVAGGASRTSEMGQLVVRSGAVLLLLLLCLVRRTWTVETIRTPLFAIAAVAAVCVMQLVPLPPALWTALPGRAPFVAASTGAPLPWRPIDITPDGGLNTLLSLTVPLAALAILEGISRAQRRLVANVLLAAVIVSALIGSLQLSGAVFDNPLINETVGEAAGVFANRNHQALLLACGLPLASVWAVRDAGRARFGRMAAAGWLMVWLLLLVLATGSRAGIVLAIGGLAAAGMIAWSGLRGSAIRWPRRTVPVGLATIALVLAGLIALGLSNDRALSLQRLFASDRVSEVRLSSLPLLWEIAMRYFPVGAGFGSFDPIFRIAEPFALLKPTYLNHAHNEAIELLIEAGALGAAAVLAIVLLWLRAGMRCVHDLRDGRLLAFAGWAIVTLTLASSLVDYPIRTPIMMTIMVTAIWLAKPAVGAAEGHGKAALPA